MSDQVLRLGVNVDHVATLREARGAGYPQVAEAAEQCVAAGSHGITIHLREDRRHIQDADVYTLKNLLSVPLNLEMANAPEIVSVALDVCPDDVCLVPEKREEITTEGGLDAAGQKQQLKSTIRVLSDAGIAVSLFIEPEPRQIRAAADLGAPKVELHTGTYCNAVARDPEGDDAKAELARLVGGAESAHELGLVVNAGHGLNLDNIDPILDVPYLDTLNIGHSIVARAVFVGIKRAVKEMLEQMARYRGGRHE